MGASGFSTGNSACGNRARDANCPHEQRIPAHGSALAGHGPAPQYVHLKVHSAYSLLEGAITIPRLAKLAVGNGFPALGLTDTNNLFGALEFSDKIAAAGIQPIVGCTLQVDFGDRAQGNGLARPGANQAALPARRRAGADRVQRDAATRT